MEKVKKILTDEGSPILAHFNSKKRTTLLTDACEYGLGFLLAQHDKEDPFKGEEIRLMENSHLRNICDSTEILSINLF